MIHDLRKAANSALWSSASRRRFERKNYSNFDVCLDSRFDSKTFQGFPSLQQLHFSRSIQCCVFFFFAEFIYFDFLYKILMCWSGSVRTATMPIGDSSQSSWRREADVKGRFTRFIVCPMTPEKLHARKSSLIVFPPNNTTKSSS